MSATSKIEWCDRTWNPQQIFVNSMSDLFHEDVPDSFIDRVFATMALCDGAHGRLRRSPKGQEMAPAHTYQLLTKRPARMHAYLTDVDTPFRVASEVCQLAVGFRPTKDGCDWRTWEPWPLQNVWLGVSCENQETADERIPLLLQTPAAVRFVSGEPLLGPVDLARWLRAEDCNHPGEFCEDVNCRGETWLDWVIVGGESGPGARPFDLAWARSILAQCKAAGVPVFVKQLGAWPYSDWCAPFPPMQVYSASSRGHSPRYKASPFLSLDNQKGGDPSEWPEDVRVREFPRVEATS